MGIPIEAPENSQAIFQKKQDIRPNSLYELIVESKSSPLISGFFRNSRFMPTASATRSVRNSRLRTLTPPPVPISTQDSYTARFSRVAMLESLIEIQRIRNRRRLFAGLLLIGLGAAAVGFALVW